MQRGVFRREERDLTSTNLRLGASCSFQAAMQRLSGTVVAVSETKNSPVAKGETLEDFVRVMERYCDVVGLGRFQIAFCPVPKAGA